MISYSFGGVINIRQQFDDLNNLTGLTTIIQYKDFEKPLKKPIAFVYHFHRYIKSDDPETFTSNAETIYGLVGKQSNEIIEIRRPYSREFRKTNSDRIWLIESLSKALALKEQIM